MSLSQEISAASIFWRNFEPKEKGYNRERCLYRNPFVLKEVRLLQLDSQFESFESMDPVGRLSEGTRSCAPMSGVWGCMESEFLSRFYRVKTVFANIADDSDVRYLNPNRVHPFHNFLYKYSDIFYINIPI